LFSIREEHHSEMGADANSIRHCSIMCLPITHHHLPNPCNHIICCFLQKRIADLGMGWGSRDGVLELMDVLPIPQDATVADDACNKK